MQAVWLSKLCISRKCWSSPQVQLQCWRSSDLTCLGKAVIPKKNIPKAPSCGFGEKHSWREFRVQAIWVFDLETLKGFLNFFSIKSGYLKTWNCHIMLLSYGGKDPLGTVCMMPLLHSGYQKWGLLTSFWSHKDHN